MTSVHKIETNEWQTGCAYSKPSVFPTQARQLFFVIFEILGDAGFLPPIIIFGFIQKSEQRHRIHLVRTSDYTVYE